MRTFQQRNRGFTLIEVLVYLAVLVTVSVVVVVTFISLKDVFERNRVDRAMGSAAYAILDRVIHEAQAGTSIDVLASTLNATSSMLVILDEATTTTFAMSGGVVGVTKNGVDEGPLNPSEISVTMFRASRFANAFSEGVRVELWLSSSSTVASTTKKFYGVGVLRGSYE